MTELDSTPGISPARLSPARILEELDAALEDAERLLKDAETIAALTERGLNASLAMLAIDGLRAYARGEKNAAARDLGDAAHEIAAREGFRLEDLA